MEDLLFYLLEGLVRAGKVVRSENKIANEDALKIELKCSEGHFVATFAVLRSELNSIREEYNMRRRFLCESERVNLDKLFNALQ